MAMTYLAVVPLLLILYIYAGYPIVLKIVSLLRGKSDVEIPKDRDNWPTLSIVVTAHNAAHLISEKLSNLSLIEYPGEMDINFVLDGCTDQTAANVQEFSNLVPWDVHVVETEQRNGKEVAIRNAMPSFRGEALMFSDADAELKPDTVLELVKKLKQPDVGVVCGRELHLSREKNSAGEGQGCGGTCIRKKFQLDAHKTESLLSMPSFQENGWRISPLRFRKSTMTST